MTSGSGRPRVLILGGGFGGVGAAQKLKDADADVVLVDRHDYHTFQPLLYQLATGLLDTGGVGHSLRDLLARKGNTTIHKAAVTGIDLDARQASFEDMPPITYDYLVLGLGAEVNFFGTEGAVGARLPDVHAAPRSPSQESHPRALGGRGPRYQPHRGRRPEHRGRGRRSNRDRNGRAPSPSSTASAFSPRLQERRSGRRAGDAGRGRAGALPDVQAQAAGIRDEGTRGANRRGEDRRRRLVGVSDTRHAEVRRGAEGPHARLGSRAAGK